MRYTLWSHGRLVGHTELDLHTVTPTMRQGFVEPTEEGKLLLADATAVWRAIAEQKRATRARGERPDDHLLVLAAMQRREELAFELRDENDAVFACEFVRITDLVDLDRGLVNEMNDTEEEQEAAFQIHLSTLSPEAQESALAERAEMIAQIEAMVDEFLDEREEAHEYGSAWPPLVPEDPRWNTMQYLIQVHLSASVIGEVEL